MSDPADLLLETIDCSLPWNDTTTWIPGDWYPMPVGYHQRNTEGYIVNGYDIFTLDEETAPGYGMPGDIVPVDIYGGVDTMSFGRALAICEAKNKRKMLG